MKKIILGCAAVLLSLGLLAGCNNKEDEPPIEEAVVITVDSAASVVVGESLSLTYTVSPEKAEVIAASDNEDVVTAVAQEGTLYLEGVAEGSAIVTLVGTYEGYASANKNINVSVITKEEEDTEPGVPDPTPETPEVTLTINSLGWLTTESEPVELTWSVTPEDASVNPSLKEETEVIDFEEKDDGWWITPKAIGTATIVVDATYTSDEGVEYTPASEEVTVTVHSVDEEQPTEVTGLVISIELTLGETTPYVLPEWLDIYLLGDWASPEYSDLTAAVKLEYDEVTQAYTTTINQSLVVGEWYHYHLFAVYNTGVYADQVSWEQQLTSTEEYFQVETGTEDGATISMPFTLPEGFEDKYTDPNAAGTVQQHENHKINFFFVDDVDTPETYYAIPSYADGYLTGYFTSTTYTEYEIDGPTKLTANGEEASNGYSVTLSLVDTGPISVNIYFEHNGTGAHSAATTATWSPEHRVFEDEHGEIVIDRSDTADHSDVYLAYNPSEHIFDEAASEYALVGDFEDSDWNESPNKASKYYYEQSEDPWTIEVTMKAGSESWNPSFYVVEYGTWDNVCGYSNLTAGSSGVLGQSNAGGIEVSWGGSYTIVVDMNASPATISVTAKS